MNKKCLGCGSILQNDNPQQIGYTPIMENSIYCKRCFRLLHYHEIPMDPLPFHNEELLKKAISYQKPIYYFIDLFQISKEALSPFFKIPGEKYLVLTKIDLIPKTISIERFIKRFKMVYGIEEKVFSYTKKSEKLLATILHQMQMQDTFILLGMTNAGKSSFLKEAVRYYQHENCPVLVSEMPNTTLSFLSFDVNGKKMIDAPGFSFETKWKKEILLKMVPKKYLKPITMQMKMETILNFENTIYFLQNLEQNSFTFYGNNEFQLEKNYKLEAKDWTMQKIEISNKCDLVLPGIGFFSISKPCLITLHFLYPIVFEIRESLFGGNL